MMLGALAAAAVAAAPLLDVLIDGETIAAVLAPGSTALGADLAASAGTVIDATGKYVVPGGVDAHTHMEMPFGGTSASDTFESGTTAAAASGSPGAVAGPKAAGPSRTFGVTRPTTTTAATASTRRAMPSSVSS